MPFKYTWISMPFLNHMHIANCLLHGYWDPTSYRLCAFIHHMYGRFLEDWTTLLTNCIILHGYFLITIVYIYAWIWYIRIYYPIFPVSSPKVHKIGQNSIFPINSHGKFPICNIFKIAQVKFPWKFTGNCPPLCNPSSVIGVCWASLGLFHALPIHCVSRFTHALINFTHTLNLLSVALIATFLLFCIFRIFIYRRHLKLHMLFTRRPGLPHGKFTVEEVWERNRPRPPSIGELHLSVYAPLNTNISAT